MGYEGTDSGRSKAGGDSRWVRFDWDGISQPSTAVAEAVATATDREPTELTPIYESIDSDALDTLVVPAEDGGGDSVHITFRYEGVDVVVDSHRGVEVRVDGEEKSDSG